MSAHGHTPPPGGHDELARLVGTLQDTQQRIFELTGGQTDAVLDTAGVPHMLPQAQGNLRQLTGMLHGILDSLPAHIALLDADGNILAVNEAWRRFAAAAGIHAGDAHIGVNYLDVCESATGDCSDEALEAAAGIRAVISGEAPEFSLEYPCHSPEEFHWFRLMVTPLADTHQQGGAVVMHVEITERKMAERALQQSEQRFRELAEHIEDVFYSFDLNAERILYVSPAYERIWGRSCQSLYDARFSYTDGIVPEDLPRARDALARQAAGEQTSTEYRIARPGGGIRWVLDRAFPIRGEDGRIERVVGTARDITGQKSAEIRLIEQAALIDQASDAIIVRDLDNRLLSWNQGAETVYGWLADEVLGKNIADILYDDPAPLDEATQAVLDNGEWAGEIQQLTKSGETVTIFGRWTLLRDEVGAPKAILTINSNVTDRKKLEEQFLRAQRMESIGTLAGGIAHDLNNVLAPILMSVDMLNDEIESKEGLALLGGLRDSAVRGADLIKQVLAFARGVEGNKVNLNPLHIARDLQKLVHETFPKSIEFRLVAPEDVWTVYAEPTQVHQVLMNLCVNARDAMSDGGRLTIELSNADLDDVFSGMSAGCEPGPYVVIKVQDTGAGIDPEIRDRIFEPFLTTKELGKGTGLGLSTTFRIVRDHGGFITLYSELGKGSTFKVYLPALVDEGVTEPSPIDQTALPRGNGELVLLVDDEESIRSVAKQALERFGYRVLLAEHGAEAVSLFAQHRDAIAVVITDMSMPVMDGPTMVVALKSMDPSVRVIGSSGIASKSTVLKASDVGVEYFVPKPYTAGTLLGTLRQVLGEKAGPPPAAPLPAGPPPAASSAATADDSPRPAELPPGHGEMILVVDDDAPLRELSVRILERAGYRVLTAVGGDEALASLETHGSQVRLLLTDLTMQGMLGSELIRRVTERWPGLKVVVMSGDRAMARLEGGAERSISKPFTVAQLRTIVREVLDS